MPRSSSQKHLPHVRFKSTKQLKLLNEFSTQLQSFITSVHFFEKTIQIIQDTFHYYSIILFTTEGDSFVIPQAQLGAYGKHLKHKQKLSANSLGIITHVLKTKASYMTNDVKNNPLFTNLDLPVHSKSELCVPLLWKDEVIGILNVESNQKKAFDLADQMTLETLASQMAVAITNRKLYERTQKFNYILTETVRKRTLELRKAQERILEQQKLLKRENKILKNLMQQEYHLSQFIGKSTAIVNLLKLSDRIASSDLPIFIQGESGTGKELLARRIHQKSTRSRFPFVPVHCVALSAQILESQLFGHEKGAYEGAHQKHIGFLEMADGGTLFLDDVQHLSLPLQAKLLHFLTHGTFYRLGGKKPIPSNIHIICANQKPLDAELQKKQFRQDLFYRLSTLSLHIPPLRERPEDIPVLIEYFLHQPSLTGLPYGKTYKIQPSLLDAFKRYHWPGNVRELANTIEHLKLSCENGVLKLEYISSQMRTPTGAWKPQNTLSWKGSFTLEEIEKNHILETLKHEAGNKTQTAKSLGITVKTLYNKLHRYGIPNQKEDSR